ncbi:MAG: glycosyltransferase family 2 protein [Nitrospiria bacterium]
MASNENTLVTIGLPFYNNEKTLPDAIRSVFIQSHTDWELILVDDGSTDNSVKIARSVVDSRVRVISEGSWKGLSFRLNQIATLAKGRYLARMDADDLMHPQRLEMQVKYLEENPEIDLIGTATYIINQHSNVVGVGWEKFLPPFTERILRKRILFVHPTVFGKIDWFRRNPYNEEPWCSRAQDYELWIRASKNSDNRFGHISNPLFYYRELGVFSLKKYKESMRCGRSIVKRYGPEIIGKFSTNVLILRLFLQEFIYSLAFLFKIENRLLRYRNKAMDRKQKLRATTDLKTIMNYRVPGFDENAIKSDC